MEEAVKKIRSVLISTKGKSDLRTLQKDFKMIMGEDIPYRQLGCSNLEQFVRQIPSLAVSKGPNGMVLVEAVATATTKHMVDLISKQKSSKKKGGPPSRFPPRHQQRYGQRPQRQAAPRAEERAAWAGRGWRCAYVDRPRPHVHQIVVKAHRTEPSPPPSSSMMQQRLARPATPSPPLTTDSSNTQRPAASLARSASSPGSNSGAIQQPTSPQVARPRMRSHNSMPGPPPVITPPPVPAAGLSAPRHPAPTLTNTQIESLMREGVAQFDPASSVWRWSSSDDSARSTPARPAPVEISSPPVVAAPAVLEPTDELMAFARAHGLGEPVVRVIPRACKPPRTTPRLYDCHIRVDQHSYSSYPRDCATPEEARAEAARNALADLTTRHATDRRHLLLATERDVLTRLPPIIERHFHGVWAAQLVLDYEDTFGEQLPPNWLALLDTLPNISVEPSLDNRYVLKFCKTGKKEARPLSGSSGSLPVDDESALVPGSDVSVPSQCIRLTEEGWLVQVTYAASTVEVWCRRVDSDGAERYRVMAERMQEYYGAVGGEERATSVAVGGYYAVLYEECWSRVRVLTTDAHEVNCFFIDYGDEHTVSRADLHVLRREFAREQAQAFLCRLSGLEELADMEAGAARLEHIASRTFMARPQMHDISSETDSDGSSAIAVVLYQCEDDDDGSGDGLDAPDGNVNRLLLRQMCGDAVPSLSRDGVNSVFVTHATDRGDVYVQPPCEGFSKLTELVASLESVDWAAELPGVHLPQVGGPEDAHRLYLARWSQGDNNLYRARVTDRSPDGRLVNLFFIDFGNAQIVPAADPGQVFPLERISEVLCAFPPLATRVRLDVGGGSAQPGFAKRVLDLMPSERPVLLRIVGDTVDSDGLSVPVCEMFRRSGSSNELTSVGASLRWGTDTTTPDALSGDGNNNNGHDKTSQLARKLERLKSVSADVGCRPVPSAGELTAPPLPGPGAYLDVRVPFAVNPWNFFVQPYQTWPELSRLMQLLHEYCSAGVNGRVQLCDVVPGRIYASKHTDGMWYRTSVIKVINSGSISVFYCDFGYYANLTVEQLVPLADVFLALPYQAVKARLAGVRPRDSKWSMDDCRHFEQLVAQKTFVSEVVAVRQDELYKCDAVLVLRLIDTSTDQDIFVDRLLVEQAIAAAVDEDSTSA